MINNDSVVLLIVTVFTGIDVYAQMNNDNYVSYFNCFNDNVIIQLAPPFGPPPISILIPSACRVISHPRALEVKQLQSVACTRARACTKQQTDRLSRPPA